MKNTKIQRMMQQGGWKFLVVFIGEGTRPSITVAICSTLAEARCTASVIDRYEWKRADCKGYSTSKYTKDGANMCAECAAPREVHNTVVPE